MGGELEGSHWRSEEHLENVGEGNKFKCVNGVKIRNISYFL